ncbi:MAG: phosphomethylpyrimidine synthase ThiC [Oscillospiraceae bacterium]|nr:phosphomethylpyrimidine synthase ThiC [Oscillospiraceae bacterium]MDY3257360.1 phosphomethylpyrimidine synthase ThiC [Ruminococcus callidus]
MAERKYYTQMDAARKGIVTPELKIVAEKEKMTVEELIPLVASGKVVIPANINHKCLNPEGIGSMLRTKINVNLGISKDCKDYDVEMEKVMSAVKMGGEAIMDLSSHGNTQPFRQKLTSECPAMIGTVPVYDSVIHYQRDLDTLTAKDFIDVVRLHAQDGVDFVTLHCGITRKTIEQIRKHKRKMNIVSRGGSLVFAWMCMTGEENPFYEYYDEILDICREYDVTVSLGDACRPGCLADATDVCQIEELVRLGELTKRAWEKDVQVMVEGPGHVPMNQIAANMKVQQTICMGAPFYVLGPLVTDIAPGYDHITSAIGGAIAAMSGAAFLCYVTPAEHLALPNLEDVKQGIIASKIAAHAADIAKGIKGARDIDDKMADARRVLDWDKQWECAIDPETAKKIRADRMPEHEDTCSMCGKFCAVRSMNKALNGEHIDIL